jgi:hypothetical protein
MKNIRRVVLRNNPDPGNLDGGSSVVSGVDMFDPLVDNEYYIDPSMPVVNYSYYIKRLAQGMSESYYFWINMGGGRPLSRMTRDKDYDTGTPITHYFSNGAHDVILEMREGSGYTTTYVSGAIMATANANFTVSNYNGKTMFQLIDILAGITSDRKYSDIEARPIGYTNTEYYKIDTGRWTDAFFNGTDFSELHGALADDNYITARAETALPWYSNKPFAQLHSFMFEDTWAFYRLGLLQEYTIPNEYVWIPFVGPNKQVPIGWMTSSAMWYSVIGTYDMQMALEYLYGGIFMGYKETVLGFKNLALSTVIAGMEGTGIVTSRLQYLVDQSNALDDAWAALDLRLIDKIGQNIINAIGNKSNPSGKSMPRSIMDKIANRTCVAYALLKKDESDYSYVDTGLDQSGSDLSLGAVGDIIVGMIESNIIPALEQCQILINGVFGAINAMKQNIYNSTLDLVSDMGSAITTGFTNLIGFVRNVATVTAEGFQYVGDKIMNVSLALNQSIADTTKNIVSWTQTQLTNLGEFTRTQLGELSNFVNDTVFGLISDVVYQMKEGIISVVSGTEQIGQYFTKSLADAGSGIIGGATVIGASAGALLGASTLNPVAAVGGALAGGALGYGLGNLVGGPLIKTATGLNTVMYGTDGQSGIYGSIYDTIGSGYDIVTKVINQSRDAATGLIDDMNKAFQVGINHTSDFVSDVGDFVVDTSSFATGLMQDFGEGVNAMGQNLVLGIEDAMGKASGLVEESVAWSKTMFQNIIDSQIKMVNSILITTRASISNSFQLIQLVLTVMGQVSDIIERLVVVVGDAFKQVGQLFEQTAQFLSDLVGTSITIAVDFSRSLAEQLLVVEDQIAKSLGFYPQMQILYDKIRGSRTAASLLEYAQETMGNDKDIFFKWADVVQPISSAKGGDSGFRVWQIGSEFADRLYFVSTYQGVPTNVDEINVTISRPSMSDEVVNNNFLEAVVPAYHVYDGVNLIEGLYYCSFNTSTVYQWHDALGYVKTEHPRPTDYLVRSDMSYITPLDSPHAGAEVNNTWMQQTTLYEAQYTQDAFPILTIQSSYPAGVVAGTVTPLVISVKNEMYSQPTVSINIRISTQTGFVIASRDIANLALVAEGSQSYNLQWQPLSTTPTGTYDLLISVVESNGDTTTKYITVNITSGGGGGFDIFGWIIGIFTAVLSLCGLANVNAYSSSRRQGRKLTGLERLLGVRSIDMPSSCLTGNMSNGKCSIDGLKLDCDASTKKCTIVP